MSRRFLLVCLLSIAVSLLSAGSAFATPFYDVKATWGPTNLPSGGVGQFTIQARNIGDETAEKKLFITDQLPAGVTATAISWRDALGTKVLTSLCSGVGANTVKCEVPATMTPEVAPPPSLEGQPGPVEPDPTGYLLPIFVEVEVEAGAVGAAVNKATVSGGGAPSAFKDEDQVTFSAVPAPFGPVPGSFLTDVFKEAYPGKSLSRQAGDHPFELRTEFDLTAKAVVSPFDGTLETPASEGLRTVKVTLPRGLVGNPEALPKCSPVQFAQPGVTNDSTRCPANSQVGYIDVNALVGEGNHGNGDQVFMPGASAALSRVPLYNLTPPNETLADLAFSAQGYFIGHVYATLNPEHEYAIEGVSPNSPTAASVSGAEVTIWGVPADPAHDKFRYFSHDPVDNPEHLGLGAPFEGPVRPFFANPMDCGFENGGASIQVDSYQRPDEFSVAQESQQPLDVSGCDDQRFHFEPEVALQPTDRHADAPTGLDVHLEVPQQDDEVESAAELYAENGAVNGIATPPIKKAVVTLPQGMTLNPSAAQGLGSCSLAQIGISPSGVPNDNPVACPDNSQYGTLVLHSPNLPSDAQPEGRIYIAKQAENPFGGLLALYLAIEDHELGLRVKIPGRVDLDPGTGQVTTTFDDLPQFPVSDMQLSLKGGVRAGLVEPSTCGTKTITAQFFSWQEPGTPRVVKSSYEIAQKPNGTPCVGSLGERPFDPAFQAGTIDNSAGEYSPFVFRLTRSDEDQELSKIGVTLPPGLAAKFAGIGECPESAIARAEARKREGEGILEQREPSCPASSLIGSTEVGTGVGVPLTYVPGKVYLAGPYKGAPLSVVAISPAVAGPFDLGTIVVRTALNVNPETAQGSAQSDPFPQIVQGIPVRIRDVRLNLDRSEFTLNPTSCAEKQVDARVTGTSGDVSSTADDSVTQLSNRFQAAHCASLRFTPRLALHLFGPSHRGANPRLEAVVKMRPGDANIGSAQVALPSSEFVDNAHFDNVCTRVQFAAHECPAGSVYGFAVAKTPLFDFPLKGPVYLRSAPGRKLPDVVAALRGPASMPIEVDLDGHVDSVHRRLRTTFKAVPDAPVTEFTLRMAGGKKGLIQNSANLCARTNRAIAKFQGQNGMRDTLRPAVKASCHGAPHRKHRVHLHR